MANDIDLSGIDQWESEAGISLNGIDDWEREAGIAAEPKAAKEKKGSVAGDVGRWWGAGANELVAAAGWGLKALSTPERPTSVGVKGAVDSVAYWANPLNLAREAVAAAGGKEAGQSVMEQGLSGAEHFREGLSDRAKAAREKKFLTTDDDAAWRDPYAVAGMVIESLPGMVLPMGPAASAAKTAATGAAARAAEQALARGAAREVVEAEARAAATAAAKKAAVTASVAGEAAVVGGSGGQQTYQTVMEMPEEKLLQAPQYRALLDEGADPEQAREQLAMATSKDAALASAVIGAAAGRIGAKYTGKVLSEPASGGITRNMGEGLAREGVEEALQSGGEQFGQNLAINRNVDAEQELLEGVGESMAAGAVAGGVMGAGLGALHRADTAQGRQPAPVREAAAAAAGAVPSEADLQQAVEQHQARAVELRAMAEEARGLGNEGLAARLEAEASTADQLRTEAEASIERNYRGLTGVVNRNADVVNPAAEGLLPRAAEIPALPAPSEDMVMVVDSQGQARRESPTNLRLEREAARAAEREQLAARGDTAVPSAIVPDVKGTPVVEPARPAALPAPSEDPLLVADSDGVVRAETAQNMRNQRATDRAARAEALAAKGDTAIPTAQPGAPLVVRSGGNAWAPTKAGLEQAQRALKARGMEQSHAVVRANDGYALAPKNAVVRQPAPAATMDTEQATPAVGQPGSDAGNGFKHGPDGQRYRVFQSATLNGGVALEKRSASGRPSMFAVGKDGEFIDGDTIRQNAPETKEGIWQPTPEQAKQATAILEKMGRLALNDPARKALKQQLRDLVTGKGEPASPRPAQTAKPEDDRRQPAAERRQSDRRLTRDHLHKPLEEMTPQEMIEAADAMRSQLLENPMTGLPSKAVWETLRDSGSLGRFVASIDADALKWFNDNIGHQEGGDRLLGEIGRALKAAGADAYHISGDEFYATADSREALEKALREAQSILAGATISGNGWTVKGVGFSYGIGENMADAEHGLHADKSAREASGLRAGRGAVPPGATKEVSDGQAEAGREGGEARRDSGDEGAVQAVRADDRGGADRSDAAPPRDDREGSVAPAPPVSFREERARALAERAKAEGNTTAVAETAESSSDSPTGEPAPEKSAVRRDNFHDEPSDAQKEAGNYPKEKVKWNGLDISIETQAGTMRRGTDESGKAWEVRLAYDYGYIRRTEGADGDHVDVYLGPNLTGDQVFIVDQTDGKGGFDEHKVMLGFETEQAAREAYLANYTKGWDRIGGISALSVDQFKDWLKSGDTKKPAAKAAPAEKPSAARGKDRIEDFGEKIGGARKDLWGTFTSAIEQELPADLEKVTLSKYFPEPDYEKMIAAGAPAETLAVIKALRDQIPAKPRRSWKLNAWVDGLKVIRDLSSRLLAGEITVNELRSKMLGSSSRTLADYVGKLDVYVGLGYPAFLKAEPAQLRWGTHFTYDENDQQTRHPDAYGVFYNGRRVVDSFFKDKDEAIAALRAYIDGLQEQKKDSTRKTKLDLYRVTATGKVMIGKQIGTNRYIDLRSFDSVKEARAYLAEHEAELVAELEKIREEQTSIPTRRSTNDPRRGEDYRLGDDITPEQFGDAFGFRGVEFGNWVEQRRRQQDLNNAFDALMDLAKTLGVPPKAISLNGTLGLAFGARGTSRALAHYEPDKVVINLTKREGAGSLGHEWWHAMDNYFSRARAQPEDYVSARPYDLVQKGIRPEVLQAFKRLMEHIKESPFAKRSRQLDRKRPKDYWSTPEELSARAFESYLIAKAHERGDANDYLANIIDPATAELVFTSGTGEWPYPFDNEMGPITKAFDHLFATIKTKETDKGVAMYSVLRRPVRAPWNNFPPVEALHKLKALQDADAEAYRRAKAGDADAALDLVGKVVTDADIERLRGLLGGQEPVIVPVVAEEKTGRNRLPQAFAAVLSDRLGLATEDRIVQTVRAHHTDAGAFERIARQPQFGGPVEKGQAYLIVDDTLTLGGTLAALRGYIESRGGKVVLASTLTGFQDRNIITPTPAMLAGIRAKHPDLPKWWNDEYGFPLEHLTQGELGHLKAAPSLDAIRDRLAQGRLGGNHGQDEGTSRRQEEARLKGFSSAGQLATHLRATSLGDVIDRLVASGRVVLHDTTPDGIADDVQGWTDDAGVIHLVADRLTASSAEPVLLHEAFHAGAQPLIGSRAWGGLQDRLKALYNQFKTGTPDGKARQFYESAMRRVEAADVADADRVEEFGAYAIEEYAGAPKAVRSWVDDALGTVKAWALRRFGKQLGAVTPAQLRALSVAALRSKGRSAGGGSKFSRRADSGAEPLYGRWQLPEPRRLVISLIDRFHRVGQIQRAVREQGGTVTESTDAHGAEQRYHSRASGRLTRFREHTIKPLFQEMAKAGINPEDVGLYLYARHAPERNAQIRRTEPYQNGPDGLRPRNDAGSGMSDAEAAEILADFEKRGLTPQLERFAKEFWSITHKTRNVLVNSGLEAADAVAAWEQTYQHYVPLAGRDEANSPSLAITGQGYSVRGGQKRAMGRRSKAKHILEQVIAQHEAAVIRAEKNDVAKHLLRFVQANPDPDLWEINPTEQRRYINADGVVESRAQPMTTDRNVVAVRVGGKDQYILVNDDAAARAIKQLDNRQLGIFLQGMGKVSRFLSAMFTSMSPPFVAVNFIRDLGTAMIHGIQVKDRKFAGAILRNIGPAMRELIHDAKTGESTLVQLYEQSGGRTGMVTMIKDVEEKHREIQSILYEMKGVPMAELLEAFRSGGKEGMQALGNKLRYNRVTRLGKAFYEMVETVNGVVENTTRLAAFMAAQERGVSAHEAGSIAKNLTVNFNRKGEWAPSMGALYVFFNASVQGTARMVEALKDRRVWGIVGGMVATSFAMAMLNYEQGDDDDDGREDWEQVSDWDKSRNLILMTGQGDYVKVPLPLGYNVFHVLGTEMARMARSKRPKATGKAAAAIVTAAFEAYNPVGEAVPSVLAPFWEIEKNKDHFGSPIRPDYKKDLPASQQFFGSMEGTTLQRGTQALNEAFGGNAFRSSGPLTDWNPEHIDHVLKFFGGGALRFATDVGEAVTKALTIGPDAVDGRRLPFVRQVAGRVSPESQVGQFYENKEAVEAVEREVKGLRKQRTPEAVAEAARLQDEHPGALRMAKRADKVAKADKELRLQEQAIRNSMELSPREKYLRQQELRAQRVERMKAFNRRFNEVTSEE